MTTLEDKIIKKELTPKGFIFYEYDEKTEDLVFRAFDYNVYDMQANDLILFRYPCVLSCLLCSYRFPFYFSFIIKILLLV
jgi:hypothetical protein